MYKHSSKNHEFIRNSKKEKTVIQSEITQHSCSKTNVTENPPTPKRKASKLQNRPYPFARLVSAQPYTSSHIHLVRPSHSISPTPHLFLHTRCASGGEAYRWRE